MQGPDFVNVSLTFCAKIDSLFAKRMLDMLCLTIKSMSEDFSTPIIPLPTPEPKSRIRLSAQPVDPDHAHAIHKTILAAWETVLNVRPPDIPELRLMPFYTIWGELVPAAELARYYTNNLSEVPGLEGIIFTTQEIIDHPTMLQQYELAIARRQVSRPKHVEGIVTQVLYSWGRSIRQLVVVSVKHFPRGSRRPRRG
ncbi:hypothetical protein HD806DRAFT_499540 [Xylariaceae sp. AK1471]|nr:hypothetical protein HD806DRAFT_499540 [Xylariaceae sp. AK1471]